VRGSTCGRIAIAGIDRRPGPAPPDRAGAAQADQPADNEQLARFEDEICPMVIGMPKDWTASLTRMIRDNVAAIGGKVGKPGCKVNAAVIFIDQPLELIKAFADAEPGYFNMTPRELASSPPSSGRWPAGMSPTCAAATARSWEADGQVVDGMSGVNLPTRAVPSVRHPSRQPALFQRPRRHAGRVRGRRPHGDAGQEPAPAGRPRDHAFAAGHQPGGRDTRPGSILSLFEPRREGLAPPMRLSKFDRGALRGFYTQRENNRSARQQAENIAKAIEKGAGEEPPSPSGAQDLALGRLRAARRTLSAPSLLVSARSNCAIAGARFSARLTLPSYLDRLEAESIHIMRETVAEAARPVMLYSIGKDSAVMLHLREEGFFPAPLPFPLLHVDTTWKFRDMYALRDKVARRARHRADRLQEPRGRGARASTRSTMARCTPTCGRPKG
jgi:hypothetical protein